MKYSIAALLLFGSLQLSGQSCTSAVCNAVSASESDVLAALPSNSNTNATVTVNIPSGTSNWTTGFSYTLPSAVTSLTIQGATVVSCTGTAGTSSYACSASDSTNIVDTYAGNNSLMVFTVGTGKTLRFTGVTMKGGTLGGGNSKFNGFVQILSGGGEVRYDHNHCNMETYSPAYANASECIRSFAALTEMVADHNLFDLAGDNTSIEAGVSDFGPYNDIYGNGDGNFAQPTQWGQITGIQYVESNVFNGGAPNDCGSGATQVMRYNTINDSYVGVQTHGTKSPAGPARGCRAIEAYHNYFLCPSCSPASALVGTKGATAMMWGNTVSGQPAYHFYQGGGDRQSGDETETNTPQGWGYCGTAVNGNGVGSAWDGNNPSASTGYPCLDGLGRGQDVQHLNGNNFCGNSSCTIGGPGRLNSVTGTIAWSHQYLEPQYLWMNSLGTIADANYMLLNDSSTNNKDYYYDQTAQSGSFTGAAGTGFGLLSARPSTCTAGSGGTYLSSPTGSYGVAYWATDANSGNGQLYVCTSTNTWTAVYQPAAYPHPLVNSTVPTPIFSPAPGTYSTAQMVSVANSLSGPSTVISMPETSNSNASTGTTPHANTYTNCATGYSGGSLQPAGQPVGTLYCTSADKTAAVAAGGPNNGVVTSSISGTGTSALDNGNGAGGSDSPPSLTATYGGATGTGCEVGANNASALVSGLTLPGKTSSSQLIMGITTGSPGNSSILTVKKYNYNGDAANLLVRQDCASPNSASVGGAHYEWDDNYNDSAGTYFGFGFDYNFPTQKFRSAPQGASWTDLELCPFDGSACITTYPWAAGRYLYTERYEHYAPGCSPSSSSDCAFYDAMCVQLWSGGSPVNSLTCYHLKNASTHAPISFTPISKTSWTHPQYAVQHQWDINSASSTLTATIPFSHLVAYNYSGLQIFYTNNGSTPTTSSTLYTLPVSVSTSQTIKALATFPGYTNSPVGSAPYVINPTSTVHVSLQGIVNQ